MLYKLSKSAVGLVAMLAFSAQASADGITSYTPAVAASITGSLSSGSFTSIGANSYTDIYTVTIASQLADFTAALLPVTSGTSSWGRTITYPSGTPTENLTTSSGSIKVLSPDSYQLTAGTYTLDVTSNLASGHTTGITGYSLTSSVITPVPEPSEGALLLSGIGLLGFIAARRMKND